MIGRDPSGGRCLTPGERAIAAAVFGAALDPAPVRVHRARWWPLQPKRVAMAPDGALWFHPRGDLWQADFSDAHPPLTALFVHELVHVWQHQRGLRLPLRRHPFCRYRYTLVPDRAFERYGIEQQAMIVQHAWDRLRRGQPLEGYAPLIAQLRGSPCCRRRCALILALEPPLPAREYVVMIELRPFATLGGANHGWLDAKHHFSFSDYQDPARTRWGNLRVWNDDRIAPKTGFPPHPHRDMEIITYVRSGAISHRDSLGNSGRTEAGDVQVMSAGTGITHAEQNDEDVETTLFQIWILPSRTGEKPGWGTRPFPKGERGGQFVTLASGHAEDDALPIRTDARVLGATLQAGESASLALGRDRKAYLVPASGAVEIEGVRVGARDGAAIGDTETLTVRALEDSEIVLVETAAA